MIELIVGEKGQITLPQEVLEHLVVRPGDALDLKLMSHGRVEMTKPRTKRNWEELAGILDGKTNGVRLTIEEIRAATRAPHG